MNKSAPKLKDEKILQIFRSWQTSALNAVAIVLSISGALAYISSVRLALSTNNWVTIVIYTVAYGWILSITFFRQLPYALRAGSFIFISFALGILATLNLGLVSSGRVWLLTTLIFSVLFAHRAWSIFTIVLSLIALIFFGVALNLGWVEWAGTELDTWITTTITFILLGSGTIVPVAILLQGLKDALAQEREYARVVDRERQELEKRVEERTRSITERSAYLESSAEISRQVASITNTDELINDVVTRIQKGFNLYYVGLFLVDKNNEWAVLEAGTGEAGKTMLANKHRLRIGEGMIGWCVKNANSRIALDVGEDAVRFENPVLPETRSEGALPLRSRGRVLGALTIQSVEAEAFTPEIITILQTMADQIGIAIDNAELLAKSEAALSAERKAYGYLSQEDWLALLLKKKTPSYISKKGMDAQPIEGDKKLTVLEDKQMLENNGLTATIPIKIEGHILGGVKLQKDEEQGAWTKKELELAEILVERPLSVALESARLFEQTQRRAAQERVIGESAARIRETLDIESVLETAAQELHKILGKVETEVWIDAE
jgi:GAF domain-containing protein